jgi:predicted dehydrogenase
MVDADKARAAAQKLRIPKACGACGELLAAGDVDVVK